MFQLINYNNKCRQNIKGDLRVKSYKNNYISQTKNLVPRINRVTKVYLFQKIPDYEREWFAGQLINCLIKNSVKKPSTVFFIENVETLIFQDNKLSLLKLFFY